MYYFSKMIHIVHNIVLRRFNWKRDGEPDSQITTTAPDGPSSVLHRPICP